MAQIENLHKNFISEVTTAARSFFFWKGINNRAGEDREVYRALNDQALSWNIIKNALLCNFLIIIGRLFDTRPDSFSVHNLLKECIKNIDQFSKEALRERKIRNSSNNTDDWLEDFIASAYVPDVKDFKIMQDELSKHQECYKEIYRPIRHKVIAHKEILILDNPDHLFENTNIEDIERFLWFLYQIEVVVEKLLYDGRLTRIGDHNFNEEQDVLKDMNVLLDRLKNS